MTRILFGLSHLPRTISLDDPRLPGIEPGPTPLRLNTDPLRGEVAAPDHAARIEVLRATLHAACGDYARARTRFIDRYLAFIAEELEAHRPALQQKLRPYGGLYHVEDWTWSALRPLPRAWIPAGTAMQPADFAFWDGHRAITVAAGHVEFGADFQTFWQNEILPVTPFRLAWSTA